MIAEDPHAQRPATNRSKALVGVISDTHGTLDPAVAHAFAGVDHIIHAGDFGHDSVLGELMELAPVTYVRGNTDLTPGADDRTAVVVASCRFEVVHDPAELSFRPPGPGTRVAVSGHTHLPRILEKGGTLHVNPGSATRPRGGHAPSVALVEIVDGRVDARIVYL